MSGQMNFDSGWEWGYWLSDVVTARASWDPMADEDEEEGQGHVSPGPGPVPVPVPAPVPAALKLTDQWAAFSLSLAPLVAIFPQDVGQQLAVILVKV